MQLELGLVRRFSEGVVSGGWVWHGSVKEQCTILYLINSNNTGVLLSQIISATPCCIDSLSVCFG